MSFQDRMNSGRKRWVFYDLAFGPAPPESLDLYETLFAYESSHSVKDVLELGCGTGRYLTALGKRGYTMTGVDIDNAALTMAKEKCKQIGLRAILLHGNLASWTPQHAYDAVISPNNSLKWLDNHESLRRCMTEMAKAVRPGGIMVFDLTFEMSNWRLVDWGTEKDMAEHAWISAFTSDEVSGEYRCFAGVPDITKGLAPFIETFVCHDLGEDVAIEERTTWLMFSGREFKDWVLETGLLENVRFYRRGVSTPTEVGQSVLDKWCVQCLITARKRTGIAPAA